jgi:hypothetical protein
MLGRVFLGQTTTHSDHCGAWKENIFFIFFERFPFKFILNHDLSVW